MNHQDIIVDTIVDTIMDTITINGTQYRRYYSR